MAAPIPYRGAIKLQRDRCFSEFLTKTGQPTALLAKAQSNLGLTGVLGGGKVDVTLTQAQIQGMFTTPIVLVAATSGQTYLLDDPVFYRYTFATAAYTGGGNIVIQYHTGAVAAASVVPAAQLGAASTENVVQTVTTNVVPTIGDSIEITNATGAFAGGGGTLRVVFRYLIM